MKVLRFALSVVIASSGLVVAGAATADGPDVIRPAKAGPIVRGPVTVACSRVTKARWGRRLQVYAWRDEGHHVAAVFVRRRSLNSSEHGDLAIHTARGLRVGDSERRLRRLYPRASPQTHAAHTHYRLRTGAFDAYLMAKVVDREVVQLEIWPYEFC
jgi:hypothetical protein